MRRRGRLGRHPVISILLVAHLCALTVAAIPDPAALAAATGVRASDDDGLSAWIRPALDAVTPALEAATRSAWRLTSPVRPVVAQYVAGLGLAQTWNMFGSPPGRGEYLRLRYYWRAGEPGAPLLTSTELVFPVASDAHPHLLAAFWQGHQDKSVSNALGQYFLDRGRLKSPNPTDAALEAAAAPSLAPIVGYFGDRFVSRHLARSQPAARLSRVEAWYGWTPSRPRGGRLIAPESRAAILSRYYGDVTSQPVPPFPSPLETVQREADLQWILIFIRVP